MEHSPKNDVPEMSVGPRALGLAVRFSGRLRSRLSFWRSIGASPLVLSWLEHGYEIPWLNGVAPRPCVMRNHASALRYGFFVDEALSELLSAGCVRVWGDVGACEPPHVVSPLGVVPKAESNKYRLVSDQRYCNRHLVATVFSYESVEDAEFVARCGDFGGKFDLRSGYHHIMIAEAYQTFLGFEWRGKYYVWTSLPQGIATAPYVFTQVMRCLWTYWRSRGRRTIGYLDDCGWFAFSREECVRVRDSIVADVEAAGFTLNVPKCTFEPTQTLTLLGFDIELKEGALRVTSRRVDKLLDILQSLLREGRATIRTLASVKGQIESMRPAIGARCMFASRTLARVVRDHEGRWGWWIRIEEDVRDQLQLWYDHVALWNGRPLWAYRVTYVHTLVTDASEFGWAGRLGDFWARGFLPPGFRGTSSQLRELEALRESLLSYLPLVRGMALHCQTDSQSSVYALAKGCSMRPASNAVIEEIFDICNDNDIVLHVDWIPRDMLADVDALSKFFDRADWKLNERVFSRLNDIFGPHTVDRMATHVNALLPRFNAAWWCPGVETVNCFSVSWSGENNWCNPDFNYIGKVFAHMAACDAKGTLILPFWPSRSWWPWVVGDEGRFCPWIVAVFELPRWQDLFLAGSAGGLMGRGLPPFRVLAVRVDFANRVHSLSLTDIGLLF